MLSMLEAGLLTAPFALLGLWASDFATALWALLVMGALVVAYFVASRPMDETIGLGDVGYYTDAKSSALAKKQLVERVRRLRSVGNPPPVFPNGWFCVAESPNVRRGQVKPVVLAGQNIVLFRSDEGTIHAVDSYCPHMGANLGIGGRVVDNNCIQCPFHGWIFSGESGKCTSIPYSPDTKIPEQAAVRTWPVVERNRHIYVWYHCDDAAPDWEIAAFEEIESGKWSLQGRLTHEIACHIEEIPENGADTAHLECLHGHGIHEGSNITSMKLNGGETPLIHHVWRGTWEADPSEKHVATMDLAHHVEIAGFRVPYSALSVANVQIGPGIVHMIFDTAFGKAVMIQSVTPEEAMFQRMRLVLYGELPRVFASMIMCAAKTQLQRDIYVWSNKKYVKSPLYCKDDGPIARHRRWFAQFYSANSPRLGANGGAAKENGHSLNW